jgi:hypothetical protein
MYFQKLFPSTISIVFAPQVPSSPTFYSNATFFIVSTLSKGTRYCIWLRHYTKSRKVAGSSPDMVIEFLNLSNHFSLVQALGLT